ncbi:MAG: hypothetical protein AAGD17_06975 [Bacteroidota bacterium]
MEGLRKNSSLIISSAAFIVSIIFGVNQCNTNNRLMQIEENNINQKKEIDKNLAAKDTMEIARLTDAIITLLNSRKAIDYRSMEEPLNTAKNLLVVLNEGLSNSIILNNPDLLRRWNQSVNYCNIIVTIYENENPRQDIKEVQYKMLENDFSTVRNYTLGIEKELRINQIKRTMQQTKSNSKDFKD